MYAIHEALHQIQVASANLVQEYSCILIDIFNPDNMTT